MVGKDLIMATLFGSGGGSSGSGGGGGIDALIDGSITEVSSDAGIVRPYAFYGCANLVRASFPNAESVGTYAFKTSAVEDISFPVAKQVGRYAFQTCSKLKAAYFPEVTAADADTFASCADLKSAKFPKLTNIPHRMFQYCYGLVTADFSVATEISSMGVFTDCRIMTALILRSETLCALSGSSAFSNCYHMLGTTNSSYNPNGLHDGYVYVPRSLIEEYPVATNWSALTLQYRALEDYTVDGTITGDLDKSKI